MSRLDDPFLIERPRTDKHSRFRLAVLLIVPVAAILFQVYVPLFFEFAAHLAFPLLVTVYLSVLRRNPVFGIFVGASIGLVQDSLSHQPLGMFGIAKTLVGYAAASIGMRFDVSHPVVRFVLGFLFYLFHEACYWTLNLVLLGQSREVAVSSVLLVAFLNAVVTIPLFYFLDTLKENG